MTRSDNGSEFVSMGMKEIFAAYGMEHKTSCIATLQQNGRVERKHRHILDVARSLLFQAYVPLNF